MVKKLKIIARNTTTQQETERNLQIDRNLRID